MFTCSPQIQTENMNFELRIIQDQEESCIYIKVLEIKAVQRRYVILEETFELHCRFSCSEYCAVKHASELG